MQEGRDRTMRAPLVRIDTSDRTSSDVTPDATVQATAYIGLGGNIGAAEALRVRLQHAVRDLADLPGCRLREVSALYASEPVDADGPEFLNAVVALGTHWSPLDLLRRLQAVEDAYGRQRPYPNAPRTLDLDLLAMDGMVCQSPELVLPHPRAALRAFVLVPLSDVARDLHLPGWGRVSDLLPGVAGQRLRQVAPSRIWLDGATQDLLSN